MYDAIVIGAGPAGLQAALTLGRMHRPVLLLDSGEYRNGTVRHMHNMIGADGKAPADLRAQARTELAAYADVEVRDVAAQRISGDAETGFSVSLADGSVADARRVILATGVADDLPPVPGLAELWGVRVFSCPFCDGHEHAGKPIAILGAAPRAAHLIGLLGRIVGEITVVPVGEPFAAEDRVALEELGVRVASARVEAVAAHGDGVRVRSAEGVLDVAGVFVPPARCGTGRRSPRTSGCGSWSRGPSRSTSSGGRRFRGSSRRATSPIARPSPARWPRSSSPPPRDSSPRWGCSSPSDFESPDWSHLPAGWGHSGDSNGGQTAPTSTAPPVAAGSAYETSRQTSPTRANEVTLDRAQRRVRGSC